MNRLFIFILGLLCLSCSQNANIEQEKDGTYVNHTISAGGVKDPAENFSWLKELIQKSKNDTSGNYWGCIWLENYKKQDVFVTNMMLGSGGVLYCVFDCSGNHFVVKGTTECSADALIGNHHVFIDDENDFASFLSNLKKNVVVYSYFPLP